MVYIYISANIIKVFGSLQALTNYYSLNAIYQRIAYHLRKKQKYEHIIDDELQFVILKEEIIRQKHNPAS